MSTITMILCHGTDADFRGFDFSECNDSGAFGRGFYFSNDMQLERQYSNGLDPIIARVTLQNPYIFGKRLSYDEWIAAPIEHAGERLIGMGYDGVLILQDSYVEVVASTHDKFKATAATLMSQFLIRKLNIPPL